MVLHGTLTNADELEEKVKRFQACGEYIFFAAAVRRWQKINLWGPLKLLIWTCNHNKSDIYQT